MPTIESYFDCPECGWQGIWMRTDSGACPVCGADVEENEDSEFEDDDDEYED